MLCTIGCDPEGFLVNPSGESVSAINLIGGTKDFPLPVPGGALQEDNVLIEFNTDPVLLFNENSKPMPNSAFLEVVQKVKAEAQKIASIHNLSVVYTTTREYPLKELQHPRALASGCDPDYNVYSRSRNEYPPIHSSIRGAGGHIHIGHELIHQTPSNMEALLYLMDSFVGVPMKALEGETSTRDSTYGKWGNYRPKPYGIEYRTLSAFWVQHPALIKAVFLLTQHAVRLWQQSYAERSSVGAIRDLRSFAENNIKRCSFALTKQNPVQELAKNLPEIYDILRAVKEEMKDYVYKK